MPKQAWLYWCREQRRKMRKNPEDSEIEIANKLWPIAKDDEMPKGTKVEKCYQKVKGETGDKGKAARICQKATGQSLKTGKAPKKKS